MWFELGRNESVVFYLVIFIFAALFAYWSDRYGKINKNGTKTINKLFLFISFIIAWLPMALRYYVGTDYEHYIDFYKYISAGVFKAGVDIEPGFWLINIIAHLFNFDYQFIIAISSLITFALFYIGLVSYRRDVNIGIATFILLTSYYPFICNGIRQSIAMAFVFVSYKYIAERKLLKFLLLIFLGALFHYTIICVIPFYFLVGKVGLTKWMKIEILILEIIIMLNLEKVFGIFVNSLAIFEKYNFYSVNSVKFGFGILIYVFIYLFFYFVLYKNNDSKLNAVLIDILLVGFIFAYVGTGVSYGGRLVLYFNMAYILIWPQIIKLLDKRLRIISIIMLVVVCSAFWYNSAVTLGNSETIPYAATNKLY